MSPELKSHLDDIARSVHPGWWEFNRRATLRRVLESACEWAMAEGRADGPPRALQAQLVGEKGCT